MVSFGERPEDDDTSSSRDALSLGLDAAMNLQVYGEAKSEFAPGEYAYLRLLGVYRNYRLYASAGVVDKLATNVLYPMSETLVFALEKTAELSHVPSGVVSYKWLGRNGGNASFVGKTVRLGTTAIGVFVLQCDYFIAGDRVRLFLNEAAMGEEAEMEVTVAAADDRGVATAAVSYAIDDETEGGTLVPVDIQVVDACTGDPVAGASVTVDGQLMGTTDAEGVISCGMMLSGSEHTLVITATGYIDSEADTLCNDTFTVPG